MAKLLVTGDFVVSKTYAIDANSRVKALFEQSDLNVVNLESPVTFAIETDKIVKTGPHLKANAEATKKALHDLKIGLATLGNNHILDYGSKGVTDTLQFCKENAVETVGANLNLQEAQQTYYTTIGNHSIAIVNFAENEWSSAGVDSAGANPMDLVDNTRQIIEAKKKAKFVFVIVHGGHEYHNLPSLRMKKQYRFYVDHGADLVIGHHTHCVSGWEKYNGGSIFYSLGNFLFTKPSVFSDWYFGLILSILIDENGKLQTELIPCKQLKESFELQLLEGDEKQQLEKKIGELNTIIHDDTLLAKSWKEYVNKSAADYLNLWSPLSSIRNKYVRAALRKLGINFLNKKIVALYVNLMRCEAHADLSKEALAQYLKK